jgi:hypothetical protein
VHRCWPLARLLPVVEKGAPPRLARAGGSESPVGARAVWQLASSHPDTCWRRKAIATEIDGETTEVVRPKTA